MEQSQLISKSIADAIIERPHGFSIGSRHFYLYPVTLGKIYVLRDLVDSLGMDATALRENPFAESLRLAQEKREV